MLLLTYICICHIMFLHFVGKYGQEYATSIWVKCYFFPIGLLPENLRELIKTKLEDFSDRLDDICEKFRNLQYFVLFGIDEKFSD
jgi:hypothetical protein